MWTNFYALLLTIYTIAGKLNQKKCARLLQAHVEGSSLRGISRTVNKAYNTVVSLVRAGSQKGQIIHNAHVQNIETSQISSDEFWSFVKKNKNTVR